MAWREYFCSGACLWWFGSSIAGVVVFWTIHSTSSPADFFGYQFLECETTWGRQSRLFSSWSQSAFDWKLDPPNNLMVIIVFQFLNWPSGGKCHWHTHMLFGASTARGPNFCFSTWVQVGVLMGANVGGPRYPMRCFKDPVVHRFFLEPSNLPWLIGISTNYIIIVGWYRSKTLMIKVSISPGYQPTFDCISQGKAKHFMALATCATCKTWEGNTEVLGSLKFVLDDMS